MTYYECVLLNKDKINLQNLPGIKINIAPQEDFDSPNKPGHL